MSLNMIQIDGNLTRDAEYRAAANGNGMLKIGFANNERYMDKETKEWKDTTTFLDVTLWGKEADKYRDLKKGQPIVVIGSIKKRTYTNKEGKGVETVEIKPRNLLVLQKRDYPQGNNSFPAGAQQKSIPEFMDDSALPF